MIFLHKHAEEAFWLQRRLKFLETLDILIEADVDPRDAERVAQEFKKVETPADVIARIKEIYGKDLGR
jgi:hypothetical protein